MYSRHEYAPVVERFVLDGPAGPAHRGLARDARRHRLPPAGVPLASRGRARVVNVDGVIRTLLTRGLIEELGHHEESTAILYGTTSLFLECLGLQSLEDLPALAPTCPRSTCSTRSPKEAAHDAAEEPWTRPLREGRRQAPSRPSAAGKGGGHGARRSPARGPGRQRRQGAKGPKGEGRPLPRRAPGRPQRGGSGSTRPASRRRRRSGRTARRSTSTTPRASASRSSSRRPASARAGSARTSSPPGASRSTARSSPSSASGSGPPRRCTSTACACSWTSRGSTSPSTSPSGWSPR